MTQLHDDLGACERTFRTPVPVTYTRLTSVFLVLWHVALPLALWDQCGWTVVPATFLSATALFTIDEVTLPTSSLSLLIGVGLRP